MSWQLVLSRFIYGFTHDCESMRRTRNAEVLRPAPRARFAPRDAFTLDREEHLLPALITALFDVQGRYGAWPPCRVIALLDLAGLDRATAELLLQGPCLPASFFKGPLSRGTRHTILLEGLEALDTGLHAETGAIFDELSPTLRGYVLGAFERGELGFPRDEAERFMDCLVETATFAFLNWKLELSPLPGNELADARMQ